MDRLIYYNDGIVDATDARVAPNLAGLLYGWGVFTTLKIYNGAPFAFERHWERLVKHAEKARIAVPVESEQARRAFTELVSANSIHHGRARITLLKGDTGTWRIEPGRQSELLIFTAPDPVRSKREEAITVSPYRILSSGPLAGVKRTAMLENLLALEEARGRGFTEAVMLNERGEIVSATSANIFWVEGDQLITPSLATGCIAGIMRQLLLEIADQLRLYATEGSFPVQRLRDASEVFLTSTLREIAPVASYDINQYSPANRRITRMLGREFQKTIRDAKMSRKSEVRRQ
jgi:branched-chain amino acid aminotransferase